jgi:hypothetical protein
MELGTAEKVRGRIWRVGAVGLTVRCGCGAAIRYHTEDLGCVECGKACCPACVFVSEGAVYCADCARQVYGLGLRQSTHEERSLA